MLYLSVAIFAFVRGKLNLFKIGDKFQDTLANVNQLRTLTKKNITGIVWMIK